MHNNGFITELTNVFRERQQQYIRFAYSYVRDRAEAEDMVMSAFTSLWERREELKDHPNIPALLLVAIKNKSLNYLQRIEVRTNGNEAMEGMRKKELALRIATLSACDPDKLFCDEIQSLIKHSIQELPENCREVFILSRIQHLSNKEIAAKQNISVKTVEFHMTRALKHLKISLQDYHLMLFL